MFRAYMFVMNYFDMDTQLCQFWGGQTFSESGFFFKNNQMLPVNQG